MKKTDLIFSKDIASDLKDWLSSRKYSSLTILVDEHTSEFCFPLLSSVASEFHLIQVESGEEHKNLNTCQKIWEKLTGFGVDRNGLLINLGGGVIGDMGGFCAATFKRGIDFIQIPTTLLSQVDASVGGKLGIDFMNFKNHIGVFCNPASVLIYPVFLNTLPTKELRSGFAEIIKHCLIADRSMWDQIKLKSFENQDWDLLGRHSVEIKKRIVEEDPTEKGLRKILNFGHTVGHAIESYFLDVPGKKLMHGEAIAAGMVCEAFLSLKRKFITEEEVDEISNYIFSVFGTIEIFDYDLEKILPLALQDKKNAGSSIRCALLDKIGKANYDVSVSLKEIRESITFYNIKHASAKNRIY